MCLEYLGWAKDVCLDPKKSTKKDLKYGDWARRLAELSLIPGIMSTVITVLVFASDLAGAPDALSWASALAAIPMYIVISFVGPFVGGAVTHFFGKHVFGLMKGDFKRTYNAAAYAMVPRLLLTWIPLIGGIAAGIWGIVVNVRALSNQQKISTGRALAVVMIPIVIAIVVAFAAVMAFMPDELTAAPSV